MKPAWTVIALAFALASAMAHSAEYPATGATSVVDMLQRKHDTELRAELVRDGRTGDISKLDAAIAQRADNRREHAYERVNADLARNSGADGVPLNTRALECDPDALHVR